MGRVQIRAILLLLVVATIAALILELHPQHP